MEENKNFVLKRSSNKALKNDEQTLDEHSMVGQENVTKLNGINAAASTPRKLVCTFKSVFYYPREEEVPEGNYFSKVYDAYFGYDKDNREVIYMCYILKSDVECWKKENGMISEEPQEYYVRQKYVIDTEPYHRMIESVSASLGLMYGEEFDIEDMIGATERVCLTYSGQISIGGFEKRMAWNSKQYLGIK